MVWLLATCYGVCFVAPGGGGPERRVFDYRLTDVHMSTCIYRPPPPPVHFVGGGDPKGVTDAPILRDLLPPTCIPFPLDPRPLTALSLGGGL